MKAQLNIVQYSGGLRTFFSNEKQHFKVRLQESLESNFISIQKVLEQFFLTVLHHLSNWEAMK